jgi:hypothetical protein
MFQWTNITKNLSILKISQLENDIIIIKALKTSQLANNSIEPINNSGIINVGWLAAG